MVLDDGEKLDCDLVIVAAGVRSAVAGLEDSGLDIDRGIKVNGYMQTSAPDVYAAGGDHRLVRHLAQCDEAG